MCVRNLITELLDTNRLPRLFTMRDVRRASRYSRKMPAIRRVVRDMVQNGDLRVVATNGKQWVLAA